MKIDEIYGYSAVRWYNIGMISIFSGIVKK